MRVTCDTNIFLRHPFNKGKRQKAQAIADCACGCGGAKSINPNLFDACVDLCQENPNLSQEEFLCEKVGGDVLFENFGIEKCGYTIKESPQVQSLEKIVKYAFLGFLATALVVVPVYFLARKYNHGK